MQAMVRRNTLFKSSAIEQREREGEINLTRPLPNAVQLLLLLDFIFGAKRTAKRRRKRS
jgi:hypothetical protein